MTPIKFVYVFALCLFFCNRIWENHIHYRLYNCTDDFGPIDFIFPGHWVHHPVEVDQVVQDGNMEHPGTIKRGWSMVKLWELWFAFVASAAVVSTPFALLPWWRSREKAMDSPS